MGDERKEPTPYGGIFLGVLAVVLFATVVAGSLHGLDGKIAGGLIAAALALAVLAAFFSRIEGKLKLGKDVEIPIAAARRAEEQVKQNQLVDADKVPAAVEAVKEAVSQFGTPTVTQGPPAREIAPRREKSEHEPPRRRLARNVQLVDDAVVTMANLSNAERVQVQTEIARMSHPDFREEDDPRAIKAGDQGRSYRVHKVPDSDLRLWYRGLEDHPGTLVVMGIQRKGERI